MNHMHMYVYVLLKEQPRTFFALEAFIKKLKQWMGMEIKLTLSFPLLLEVFLEESTHVSLWSE